MAAYAIVDVASPTGRGDGGSLAVVTAFAKRDRRAVVAETPASKSGAALTAADRDIPSFNSLGTETGGYTLVALLTGAEPGFYGTGDEAVAPYPPIPEK